MLTNVCAGDDAAVATRNQRAADAGAIEAAVAAMRAHPQEESIQANGVETLMRVCGGDGAAAAARKQRASDAGARAPVERAVAAFPDGLFSLSARAASVLEWL